MSSAFTKEKMPAPNTDLPRERLADVAAWTGIVAAFIFMMSAGWKRWCDPLVDFGRELYIPWRLSQGDVLYRDQAYFNGPLSPYFNAVWFKLFGASLQSITVCNLLILALIVAMLYRLAKKMSDRWGAIAAALVFIFVSAFPQYGSFGNQNYVAPYSHELTHGIAIGLAAMLLLHRFAAKPSMPRLACIGVAVGLSLLTKVEIFFAVTGAVSAGLVAHGVGRQLGPARWARGIGVLIASAGALLLIAVALLALAMPVNEAFWSALGSVRHLFNTRAASGLYFREVSGFNAPLENLRHAGLMFLAVALPAALLWLFAWRARGWRPQWIACATGGIAIVELGLLHFFKNSISWEHLARSLLIWIALLAIGVGVMCFRARRADARKVLAVAMVVFSVGMFAKMILHIRLNHYGFALAMPSLALFSIAMVAWLPAIVKQWGGSAAIARAGAIAALAYFAGVHVALSNSNHSVFVVPVGSGADQFYFHRSDTRAADMSELVDLFQKNTRADQTIAVLPEGVIANFLLRRINPTPYTFLNPFDVEVFGEAKILAAYRAHPPDFIALFHRDTSEYGYRAFGTDYARELYAWVLANYEEVGKIGPPPFVAADGGVRILSRKH